MEVPTYDFDPSFEQIPFQVAEERIGTSDKSILSFYRMMLDYKDEGDCFFSLVYH